MSHTHELEHSKHNNIHAMLRAYPINTLYKSCMPKGCRIGWQGLSIALYIPYKSQASMNWSNLILHHTHVCSQLGKPREIRSLLHVYRQSSLAVDIISYKCVKNQWCKSEQERAESLIRQVMPYLPKKGFSKST